MTNRCFLCKEEEETNDHLFLFCNKASMLWNLIFFSLFGVHWVLHSTVRGGLAWVEGKRRAKAWKAAPLCLMWALWKERNGKAYNNVERTDQAIKYSFVYYFLNWAMVYIEDHTLYLVDFIDWLFVKEYTLLSM